MAKLSIVAGATSVSVGLFIQDSTSTTGAGLAGLVFNSAGLTCYAVVPGASAAAVTLATLAAANSAYSSGGFKEIDATNMPGWYRFDVPNTNISTGRSVGIHFKGATNMAPLPLEIELTGWNNQDGVRGGMTALPNAAAEAAGGLYTRGTGAGQINQAANGQVDTNVARWLNTAVSTPTVAGVPNVNAKTWNDLATVELPLVPTTAGRKLDVSAGGEAGVDWANVGSPTTVLNLSNTTVKTATDVATDTAAIKIKTDFLPSATAGAAGGVFIAGTNAPVTITGSGTALTLASTGANGRGLRVTGNGSGAGFSAVGGATGTGIEGTGGATSGDGMRVAGGAAGHGLSVAGVGASTHGLLATSGASGAGDGISAVVAGGSGVPIRGDLTSNITGSLSGSVASVSGNVGGSVGSLATQAKADVNAEVVDALVTDVIADSIPADGTRPSIAQAAYMLIQFMNERSVSGTTMTVKKVDGSTALFTLTLNDASTPTSITRAT